MTRPSSLTVRKSTLPQWRSQINMSRSYLEWCAKRTKSPLQLAEESCPVKSKSPSSWWRHNTTCTLTHTNTGNTTTRDSDTPPALGLALGHTSSQPVIVPHSGHFGPQRPWNTNNNRTVNIKGTIFCFMSCLLTPSPVERLWRARCTLSNLRLASPMLLTVITQKLVRGVFASFGCGNTLRAVGILLIIQDRPMFSYAVQKVSVRAFHWCDWQKIYLKEKKEREKERKKSPTHA